MTTGTVRRWTAQLPARWDGNDVEWRAWMPTGDVFVCPPKPRPPCEECRSTAAPAMNVGVVRHPTPGVTNLRPQLASLSAFRCPDCGLDTIWDRDTDEWWTLDAGDYGPDGSTDPRLFNGAIPSISCREVWFRDGTWSPKLMRGSLRPDGRLIVTDRALAIYVNELDGCANMPAPPEMTRAQVVTAARLLLTPWVDRAPERQFDALYLDLLEFAGYVIRPLMGHWWHAHAVVNPAGEVVGVLMPWSLGGAPVDPATTRKVAA